MKTGSDSLDVPSDSRYEADARETPAPAAPSPPPRTLGKRLCIAAVTLTFVILLILLVDGLIFLPSIGSPLHVWTDFALLFVSVFLVIGAGLLSINRLHLGRNHHRLKSTCNALERSMAARARLLAESNAMWLALFDAFQERVVVVNRDDRIVQANRFAKAQVGYNPAGHVFSDVFPPCDVPAERRCELRLIQHTLLAAEPQRGRLIRGGPGCQSLLALDTYPVCSPDGLPELVIEIARDVTKRVEDDMRHHHQEKMAALGMLAAGFAHDLGNPLASLSSELQLLRKEHDTARIRESLSVLDRHVNRISRALRDILNFARRRSSAIGNVAVPNAVHDALRLVKHDPRAKNISIHVDLPHTMPSVMISEDDFLLILINLILNAFDAMPVGGQLSLRGETTPTGHLRLMVEDTGVGMDETLVRHATQALYTTKEKNGGTGLGLPLCIDIMKAAGGRLDIFSEPTKGTRIALEFPPPTLEIAGGVEEWQKTS